MTAEIISVGTELLLGNILNTNAQYLSRELADLGITVQRESTIGDNHGRLADFVNEAKSRCDLLVFTGGLGPTADDLTKETVAACFGDELAFDEAEWEKITSYFARTGRETTPNNRKQAMVPTKGHKIINNHGTAPGAWFEQDGHCAVLMPGVPHEMKAMWTESVRPLLMERQNCTLHSVTLRVLGGESDMLDSMSTGMLDIGAKSSNLAMYSADSSAASTASGFTTKQAVVDSPELATYSLDAGATDGMSVGANVLSEDAATAAEDRQASTSPKIIYTANLTLESKDYDDACAQLETALSQAGGYLESSSEYSNSGSSRCKDLTFRVPEENYQSFLDAVAQAGNVTYKSQQADDVTTQYMDVETRLSNLEAQRTRLQELQAQADNLSDLLQIESSLTDVQSQIESWESQLDWYSNQVQQCTVYVNLSEVQNYTPTDESFFGRIGTAFAQGWSNFVDGLQQLVVILAGAWPVVLVVAAAVVGFVFWRKKRKN